MHTWLAHSVDLSFLWVELQTIGSIPQNVKGPKQFTLYLSIIFRRHLNQQFFECYVGEYYNVLQLEVKIAADSHGKMGQDLPHFEITTNKVQP